jgi:hypothetical protein
MLAAGQVLGRDPGPRAGEGDCLALRVEQACGYICGVQVVVKDPAGGFVTPAFAAGCAGLLGGLLNTARQVGGSLGLAILATAATAATTHTHALERTGAAPADALAAGFGRAFLLASVLGIAAFAAAFVVPARFRAASCASAGGARRRDRLPHPPLRSSAAGG